MDNILPFIERQTYEANITLRIGQASYGDLFRDLESPLLKGDIVTIRYDKGAAVLKEGTTYQILIYNTSNKSEVINNSANFGEDYTFTLPYDVQAIRANITDGSKIIATGVSTGHITVSSELEKTVKNVDEIQKAQQKLSIVNCLLGRHKPVYRINEDEVYDRPQSKLCAIKSFWPKIDYRGIPVFEEMVNYTGFNPLAPIHFEEQFIFVNRMDYPYIGVSYISSNIREWKKYTHLSKFDYSLLGENQNGGNWGVSANEYGLSIFETSYYKQAGNGKIHSIFWSLDGGRSYEPAINNLRAYTSILKSELQEGSTITIDDKSITVVSAEDIYTYLSNFYNGDSSSGMSSEQLIENAKEYLSDKVIYSTNENDTLRNLAGILIDIGYKVRLRDNDLIIYYKDLGTAGNNHTFTIDSTTKTFNGGVNYNDRDTILNACTIDFIATGVNYLSGQEVKSTDLILANSCLFYNNKWHIFGHYANGTECVNLDLIIDDISNLAETSYKYVSMLSESGVFHVEPFATYDNVNNRIIVSFRTQRRNTHAAAFIYSDDGENWSDLVEIGNSPYILQGNSAIFLACNPTNSTGTELFYNWPSSDTNNIYIAVIYDRRNSCVHAATAEINGDLEDLNWSPWIKLDHYSEFMSQFGFTKDCIYYSDTSGFSSIGDFAYSHTLKGLVILYNGFVITGKKATKVAMAAIEPC